MMEEAESFAVLGDATTDEQPEPEQCGEQHVEAEEALTRLRPSHEEVTEAHPERDLAQWRAGVDPRRPGERER